MNTVDLEAAEALIRSAPTQLRGCDHPRITVAAGIEASAKPRLRYSETELARLLDMFRTRNATATKSGLAILEIGLDSGMPHLIWRTVAGTVVTVEPDFSKALSFVSSLRDDEGSQFIVGPLNSPVTARSLRLRFPNISFDMVVFNGPLYNSSAIASLWALYDTFAKPGAPIVFPEASDESPSQGVLTFIAMLKGGQFGEEFKNTEFNFIVEEHSRQGFAYYFSA